MRQQPWVGAVYAANTGHHRATDDAFLGDDLRPGDRVLDIGSGAGDLTRAIAARVSPPGGPAGSVIGLEPSADLIAVARAAVDPDDPHGPTFVRGRAQDVGSIFGSTVGAAPFDAVVTKAALHWVPESDHPGVLRQIHALLRPGGVLRADFGGGDNVAGLTDWLDPLVVEFGGQPRPWYFPQPGRYLELVLDAGFDVSDGWVRVVAQRRPFDRDGVIGLLRSQVLVGYCAGLSADASAAFVDRAIAEVDRLRRPDGSYDVTYARMDVRATAQGRPR